MLFSISQHSLHEVSWRFLGRRIVAGSVFPFFDDTGMTRAVMVTTEQSGNITLLEYQEGLFAARAFLPRLWPQRTSLQHAALQDCTEEAARSQAHLWHFDPWWELAAERYGAHPAVPILKTTNLPGSDDSITRVWFDRALSRVTWIGYGEGESMYVRRFRPELLATAARRRGAVPGPTKVPQVGSGEWRLRPFWQGRS